MRISSERSTIWKLAMTTGYILVGVTLEERDLVAAFGARYEEYRRRVPMLIPFLPKGGAAPAVTPMPTPDLDRR